MARLLVRCLVVNAAGVIVCTAMLLLFPRGSGFTITTPTSTHYIQSGVFLSAVLMCLVDLAIAISVAWSLLHLR